MTTKFYDCIIMLRFSKTKGVKEEVYSAKKPIKYLEYYY